MVTAGRPLLRLPRFETDQVGLVQVNFGGVFDKEDPVIGRDELSEGIEQRRFPSSRTAS